jgi:hypothetical protein
MELRILLHNTHHKVLLILEKASALKFEQFTFESD